MITPEQFAQLIEAVNSICATIAIVGLFNMAMMLIVGLGVIRTVAGK